MCGLNADRIAGDANGQPITLSDIRRQVEPFVEELRRVYREALQLDALERLVREHCRVVFEHRAERFGTGHNRCLLRRKLHSLQTIR